MYALCLSHLEKSCGGERAHPVAEPHAPKNPPSCPCEGHGFCVRSWRVASLYTWQRQACANPIWSKCSAQLLHIFTHHSIGSWAGLSRGRGWRGEKRLGGTMQEKKKVFREVQKTVQLPGPFCPWGGRGGRLPLSPGKLYHLEI